MRFPLAVHGHRLTQSRDKEPLPYNCVPELPVTASRKGAKVRAHLEHNAVQHCSPTCSRPGCIIRNATSLVNYVLIHYAVRLTTDP